MKPSEFLKKKEWIDENGYLIINAYFDLDEDIEELDKHFIDREEFEKMTDDELGNIPSVHATRIDPKDYEVGLLIGKSLALKRIKQKLKEQG